jgi:hypothetical protein
MHYFIADETNTAFVSGHFFIYGGLIVTDAQAQDIHVEVKRIRAKFGYLAGDSFKFHTRARPEQVSIEDSKLAKTELVESLERIGARLVAYVILHDIAQHTDALERMNWALNSVTWTFHRLLAAENAGGLMIIDRDDTQIAHLEHLFQNGISVGGRQIAVDDRIMLFGQTSDNASNLSSAVDITLGAFRYCTNTAMGAGSDVVAANIFPPLTRMLWGNEDAGVKRVGGYGFVARPVAIKSAAFGAKYDDLRTRLGEFSGSDTTESTSSGAIA